MTKVIPLEQILQALPDIDVIGEIERGFVALSEGRVDVPPITGLQPPAQSLRVTWPPPRLEVIGICGSGVQARLQADYLRRVTPCRSLVFWGRDADKTAQAVRDIELMGYSARLAANPAELAASSQLIVTTTAAHEPYLPADCIKPGTHITAMGSDTPEKNEIDPEILEHAALVVADSIPQCLLRGEIRAAIAAGSLRHADVVELGNVIAGKVRRRAPDDITVADLTGVAVQDIMIAKAVIARIA